VPHAAKQDADSALAAFIREVLHVLGSEIVHHPVGARQQAAE
jgi:hypothetical protein